MADNTRQYTVAVVGATGMVGEQMLAILSERDFPVGKIHALASARSADKIVEFGRSEVVVEDLDSFDFSGVDIGLFSAGASVSAIHAPRAAAAGCVVIDNTSQYRYDDEIPLVVSEVNPHALADFRRHNIIANPNCSTMQMLVALKPIHAAAGIERINVCTYQAVSGAGRTTVERLARQTANLLNGRPKDDDDDGPDFAFNVVPKIDEIQPNGFTREEMKMVWESQKILEDPSILVNATAVRVPVFYGHSEALHIETKRKIEVDEVRELLAAAAGVVVEDDREAGIFPTPRSHAAGKDPVFVGRIREDPTHPRGLNLWVVADNVRKGAALNSIQIAEILVKHHI